MDRVVIKGFVEFLIKSNIVEVSNVSPGNPISIEIVEKITFLIVSVINNRFDNSASSSFWESISPLRVGELLEFMILIRSATSDCFTG